METKTARGWLRAGPRLAVVALVAAAFGVASTAEAAPRKDSRQPAYDARVINPDFNGGMMLPAGKTAIVWGSDGTILRCDDGAQWSVAVTPTSADLTRVAAKADGSVLVAVGAAGTILRSTDAGRSWQSAAGDFASTDFKAVVWHEPSGTWIAAGTHGRIVRSKDGNLWTTVPSSLDLEFQALYVDPDTRGVLIGGEDGAVGLSMNAGESWMLTKIAMPDPLTPITGFRRHGKLLLATSAQGRFLTSGDDAQSWDLLQSSTAAFFTDSASDPRNGAIVMTGHNGNLLRSADGGKTWKPIELLVDGRAHYLSAISFDAATGIMTVVGHNGVIARSDNGGEGWISYSIGTLELRGLIHDPARHRYIAYGPGGLLQSSEDGGATWGRVRAGLDVSLRDVATTPTGNAVVATGKLGAIVRSADGGASWQPVAISYPNEITPPDLRMLVRAPSQKFLVAVGPPGTILRANDTGSEWTVAQWTPAEAERAFLWVLADRKRARLTAVEVRGEMRVSQDDGLKWEAREAPTQDTQWAFWHGAELERDGVMIVAGKSGVAARSADAGLTWSPMKTGTGKDLFGSFADDEQGLLFLMGQEGTLLRSADGGLTWQSVRSDATRELRRMMRDPKTGALVCFGAYGTIVRSEDHGLTWHAVRSGAEGELRKGIVDPRSGALFIVGSRGTILRSGDGGRSWQALPAHTKRHFNSIALTERGDLVAVGDRIVHLVRESRR